MIKVLGIFLIVSSIIYSPSAGADLGGSLLSLTNPYKKVVRKYTRENSHYSIGELTTIFKWYATYHSPNFLAAADRLMKKRYPEGASPYAAQEHNEMDPERQTEFFISLYALEPGLKRVVDDKNLWDINLKVGEKVYEAAKVDRVDIDPFYMTFYPYLERWYSGFRVSFPTNVLTSGQDQMTLIISSVRGTSRMEFDVR